MNHCQSCEAEIKSFVIAGRPITPRFCTECVTELDNKLEQAQKKNNERDVLLGSNLPKEFFSSIISFKTFILSPDQATLKKRVDEYNPYSHNWKLPYLFGPSGAGKTALAYLAAKRIISLLDKKGSLYFTTMAELLHSMRIDKEDYPKPKVATVLIIDDLCAHTASGWVLEKLYMLIDYRIKYEKPTMFTSNIKPTMISRTLSKSDDQQHICDAIQDRILGLSLPFRIQGESFRLKKCIETLKEVDKPNE